MKDSTYMAFAEAIAKESKCISHKVGCVLVDPEGRVVAHGYNGTPSGQEHCCDYHTEKFGHIVYVGDKLCTQQRTAHREWSLANEIHAEANAVAYAARSGRAVEGSVAYCTLSPCTDCQKLLVAAGVKKVVYKEMYDVNPDGLDFLTRNGIIVEQYVEPRDYWTERYLKAATYEGEQNDAVV